MAVEARRDRATLRTLNLKNSARKCFRLPSYKRSEARPTLSSTNGHPLPMARPPKPKSIAHDLITSFSESHKELSLDYIRKFESFFHTYPPAPESPHYRVVEVGDESSFTSIPNEQGFYLIASNYEHALEKPNDCTLLINGSAVIYRGQADKVRERIRSHLDNKNYAAQKADEKADVWTRCLKLDKVKGNNGGINITDEPYRNFTWTVLMLPLPGSTSALRQYVEWGFDRVFEKPVASNERKKPPKFPHLPHAELSVKTA
jgi:hypothetical protein